jgi:hypothetical protein
MDTYRRLAPALGKHAPLNAAGFRLPVAGPLFVPPGIRIRIARPGFAGKRNGGAEPIYSTADSSTWMRTPSLSRSVK